MPDPTHRSKITPAQLAREWGCDVKTVRAWIRSGQLRAIDAAVRPGGRPRFLIDRADVIAFENARAVQAPGRKPRRRRTPASIIQFI